MKHEALLMNQQKQKESPKSTTNNSEASFKDQKSDEFVNVNDDDDDVQILPTRVETIEISEDSSDSQTSSEAATSALAGVAPFIDETSNESGSVGSESGSVSNDRKSSSDTITSRLLPKHPHTCEKCLKTFPSIVGLKVHEHKEHPRIITAPLKATLLKGPFKCCFCDRQFSSHNHMTRHQSRHGNLSATPDGFKCMYQKCDYVDTTKEGILNHFMNNHATRGERIIKARCGDCSERFDNEDLLAQHQVNQQGRCADRLKQKRKAKSSKKECPAKKQKLTTEITTIAEEISPQEDINGHNSDKN